MRRLLAGLALTALLGATPSMAWDAAHLLELETTNICTVGDFHNANLADAQLSNANLSRTDLRGADLRGADLRDAYLSGAILCNTTWTDGTRRNDNC